MHGGGPDVVAGRPLDHVYKDEALPFVEAGCANLIHHINNVKKYGVECVVAINRFSTDTEAELELVRKLSMDAGAYAAVVANHWAVGGAGAVDLALAVEKACVKSRAEGSPFRYIYIYIIINNYMNYSLQNKKYYILYILYLNIYIISVYLYSKYFQNLII